ncbi:DNA replication and repair protein RecR [Monaibacterium marinum]|uniref:Recombination protein RecR n=1 Tax=Pontivivens marinum TaxID=1690039 RepID=A0A2C9CRR4_9RHOB|nr:recombination mediator RecR [Monaibacterium marinum]SOH94044.1 DNA replication and repair protein RecR [Monaibacterium marinum]
MPDAPLDDLIGLLARLPGLGPRSARRAALALVRKRRVLLEPLAAAMADVAEHARECLICGNIGTSERCDICTDPKRDPTTLCVVESVADLWAMERAQVFRGRYHVMGGTLSALDGIGPEDLNLPRMAQRIADDSVTEVILALGATVDGQTTAHYIADMLEDRGIPVTSLAQGVPVGGELDYLDDGTITAALSARRQMR